MTNHLTADQIACLIDVRGLYDGTAVYLLKDGTYLNRFRHDGGWPPHMVTRADKWIEQHGDTFREANRDLLTETETT